MGSNLGFFGQRNAGLHRAGHEAILSFPLSVPHTSRFPLSKSPSVFPTSSRAESRRERAKLPSSIDDERSQPWSPAPRLGRPGHEDKTDPGRIERLRNGIRRAISHPLSSPPSQLLLSAHKPASDHGSGTVGSRRRAVTLRISRAEGAMMMIFGYQQLIDM